MSYTRYAMPLYATCVLLYVACHPFSTLCPLPSTFYALLSTLCPILYPQPLRSLLPNPCTTAVLVCIYFIALSTLYFILYTL